MSVVSLNLCFTTVCPFGSFWWFSPQVVCRLVTVTVVHASDFTDQHILVWTTKNYYITLKNTGKGEKNMVIYCQNISGRIHMSHLRIQLCIYSTRTSGQETLGTTEYYWVNGVVFLQICFNNSAGQRPLQPNKAYQLTKWFVWSNYPLVVSK